MKMYHFCPNKAVDYRQDINKAVSVCGGEELAPPVCTANIYPVIASLKALPHISVISTSMTKWSDMESLHGPIVPHHVTPVAFSCDPIHHAFLIPRLIFNPMFLLKCTYVVCGAVTSRGSTCIASILT